MLTGVHKVASPIVQMFQVHLLVWYFPCGTLLGVSALGEASPQLWATWSVHASCAGPCWQAGCQCTGPSVAAS